MTEQYEHNSRIDEIDRHVGQKLRSRRIMMGLSQKVLCDAVGVSIQQIQKYEKATNRVTSGKLYHFAKLLNVPISYFFKDLDLSLNAQNEYSMAETQEKFISNPEEQKELKELTALIKAFKDVKDPSVRHKILDLVKSLA